MSIVNNFNITFNNDNNQTLTLNEEQIKTLSDSSKLYSALFKNQPLSSPLPTKTPGSIQWITFGKANIDGVAKEVFERVLASLSPPSASLSLNYKEALLLSREARCLKLPLPKADAVLLKPYNIDVIAKDSDLSNKERIHYLIETYEKTDGLQYTSVKSEIRKKILSLNAHFEDDKLLEFLFALSPSYTYHGNVIDKLKDFNTIAHFYEVNHRAINDLLRLIRSWDPNLRSDINLALKLQTNGFLYSEAFTDAQKFQLGKFFLRASLGRFIPALNEEIRAHVKQLISSKDLQELLRYPELNNSLLHEKRDFRAAIQCFSSAILTGQEKRPIVQDLKTDFNAFTPSDPLTEIKLLQFFKDFNKSPRTLEEDLVKALSALIQRTYSRYSKEDKKTLEHSFYLFMRSVSSLESFTMRDIHAFLDKPSPENALHQQFEQAVHGITVKKRKSEALEEAGSLIHRYLSEQVPEKAKQFLQSLLSTQKRDTLLSYTASEDEVDADDERYIGDEINDTVLERIANITFLEDLALYFDHPDTEFSRNGLLKLLELQRLKALTLDLDPIEENLDEDTLSGFFTLLNSLKNLERLNLSCFSFNATGRMQFLTDEHKIKALDLMATDIDDIGCAAIARLKELETLSITFPGGQENLPTKDGFRFLAACQKLACLMLHELPCFNAEVSQEIANFPALTSLTLQEIPDIEESSLDPLLLSKSLKHLLIINSRGITEEWIEKAKAKAPHLEILKK